MSGTQASGTQGAAETAKSAAETVKSGAKTSQLVAKKLIPITETIYLSSTLTKSNLSCSHLVSNGLAMKKLRFCMGFGKTMEAAH